MPATDLWSNFEEEVKKFCQFVPANIFNYAINISLQYNYLYTETPKAGCSTIKNFLQQLELNDMLFNRDDIRYIHNRTFSPLLKPSQVGSFEKYLTIKKPFKFCFVRNPYSRLLSVYLDKITKNQPQKGKVLQHLGKDPDQLNQTVTFEDFINVIFEQSISEMDPHWRTQYYQTFQDTLDYDFIGRLESFSKDLVIVFNKIGVSHDSFPLNKKMNETGANKYLSDFYTPELIKMVREKFAIDFDYFGYSPEFNF